MRFVEVTKYSGASRWLHKLVLGPADADRRTPWNNSAHLGRYFHSTPSSSAGGKNAHSSTVHLPETGFPLKSDAAKRDHRFARRTTEKLYKWQSKNRDASSQFFLQDGPPFANGELHMGHTLNKMLKDMVNRYHLLRGKRVVYKPGWDVHGLPIEMKVAGDPQLHGTGLLAADPVKIRDLASKYALSQLELQREQFRHFGVMADWEQPYITNHQEYEKKQLEIFAEMVRKGLVYRAHRPVHWSPETRTALAEAELEYNDNHSSKTVWVKFSLRAGEKLISRIEDQSLRRLLQQRSENVHLLIWTTTPWSLPGNMAVAVNANMSYSIVRRSEAKGDGREELLIVATNRLGYLSKRKLGMARHGEAKGRPEVGPLEVLANFQGSDLLDSTYRQVFQSTLAKPRRIIAADFVTDDSGTGLVHVAPAHGLDDYHACVKEGIIQESLSYTLTQPRTGDDAAAARPEAMICPIDVATGRFTDELVKSSAFDKGNSRLHRLVGCRPIGEGNKIIVGMLEEAGALFIDQPLQHRYPYDWRSKTPTIMLATSQWFVDVSQLKPLAEKALQNVDFVPGDKTSREKLGRIVASRREWCISRQRAWGLPIPVLYNAQTNEPLLTPTNIQHIASILQEKGTDYWWTGPAHEFVAPEYTRQGVTWSKGADTLDVWFDSGTSWLGAQARPDDPVADLYLEGTDQHRGWFQSSLLTKLAYDSASETPQAPYKRIATHGFVLNRRGEKMSKSLKNWLGPIPFIKGGVKTAEPAWGTDVVRFWAARVNAWGADVRVSWLTIKHAGEAMFHVRNTARFMLGNLHDSPAETPSLSDPTVQAALALADRYILHNLSELDRDCKSCYDELDFSGISRRLVEFATIKLSPLYFVMIKDTLYCDPAASPRRRAALAVCDQILGTYTSILAPMMPHLAEEIWHYRNGASIDPPAAWDEASEGEEESFFHAGWRDVCDREKWLADKDAKQKFESVLELRQEFNALIERARPAGLGRSGTELVLDLILPVQTEMTFPDTLKRIQTLREHHEELSNFFPAVEVRLVQEDEGTSWPTEEEEGKTAFSSRTYDVGIVIRRSQRHMCPRCRFERSESDGRACGRCERVMVDMGKGPAYLGLGSDDST
ncbi:unnamed protein product [Jaminaea pallidilutea]